MNLKGSKRKTTSLVQRTPPIRLKADFSAENLQAGMMLLKCRKIKAINREYSTWQSWPSEWKEREFRREAKAEGIHYL